MRRQDAQCNRPFSLWRHTRSTGSGSCSKDRARGRSIAGKFKIIYKNTCNAMAAELVNDITSIMCIIERTSSDISDKPAFTPPGHIKRQHCKSKEALFCNIFDFFLIVCTLDFQAGNFTCILRMKSFEDISCKRLLLQGKDLKNARRRLWKKLERFNRAQKSLFENRL